MLIPSKSSLRTIKEIKAFDLYDETFSVESERNTS